MHICDIDAPQLSYSPPADGWKHVEPQKGAVIALRARPSLGRDVYFNELVGDFAERFDCARHPALLNGVSTTLNLPQKFLGGGACLFRRQSPVIADRHAPGAAIFAELGDVALLPASKGADTKASQRVVPEEGSVAIGAFERIHRSLRYTSRRHVCPHIPDYGMPPVSTG